MPRDIELVTAAVITTCGQNDVCRSAARSGTKWKRHTKTGIKPVKIPLGAGSLPERAGVNNAIMAAESP